MIFISALAVYYLTLTITKYDGVSFSFLRLREKYPNSPLTCFVCSSIYVALPFSLLLGGTWQEIVIQWFGIAGAATLINFIIERIQE